MILQLKHLVDSDLECTESNHQQPQSTLMCDAMTLQQQSSLSPRYESAKFYKYNNYVLSVTSIWRANPKQNHISSLTFVDLFRLGNKLSIKRHATILDNNLQPIANGIVIADGWILTVGSALEGVAQATVNSGFSVRIGRSKKPVRVIRTLYHPLVPMKMHQYNVALIRYVGGKKTKDVDYPCFLTQNQFESVSKIVRKVSFTTRLSTKRRYAKLKPKKGRLSRACVSEKFICSKVKAGKQKKNESLLIDGSPLYLGRPGDSRMAGLGVYMKTSNLFEYAFIPIWSVSDWIGTVMKEFDSKCTINRRGATCEHLQLPSIEDMIMELQPMEEH